MNRKLRPQPTTTNTIIPPTNERWEIYGTRSEHEIQNEDLPQTTYREETSLGQKKKDCSRAAAEKTAINSDIYTQSESKDSDWRLLQGREEDREEVGLEHKVVGGVFCIWRYLREQRRQNRPHLQQCCGCCWCCEGGRKGEWWIESEGMRHGIEAIEKTGDIRRIEHTFRHEIIEQSQ